MNDNKKNPSNSEPLKANDSATESLKTGSEPNIKSKIEINNNEFPDKNTTKPSQHRIYFTLCGVLLFIIITLGIAEIAYNYKNGGSYANLNVKSINDFYSSTLFEDNVTEWTLHARSYLKFTGLASSDAELYYSANPLIFNLAEYADVSNAFNSLNATDVSDQTSSSDATNIEKTGYDEEKAGAVDQTASLTSDDVIASGKNYYFNDLSTTTDFNLNAEHDNLLNSTMAGPTYYYFYNELETNYQDRANYLESSNGDNMSEEELNKIKNSYIHLTGQEYYSLLNKVLKTKAELCQEEDSAFSLSISNNSNSETEIIKHDYNDENSDMDDELNYGNNVYSSDIENDSSSYDMVTTYSGDDDTIYTYGDDFTNAMNSCDDTLGYFDSTTGNYIILLTGDHEGEAKITLNYNGTLYSFAANNVKESNDYYFPTVFLNLDSETEFENSLVTSPFTTEITSLCYLNQTVIYNDDLYDEYYGSDLYEFDATFVSNDSSETIGNDISDDNIKKAAHYVKLTRTSNGSVKAEGNVPENIQEILISWLGETELKGINKVYIIFPKTPGINTYGLNYIIALISIYQKPILAVLICASLLFIFCFVMLMIKERKYLLKRDTPYLLIRAIIYGIPLAIVLFIYRTLLIALCSFQNANACYWIAFGLGSVVCYIIGYIICADFFMGMVRHIKAKNTLDNLLILKLLATLWRFVKKAFGKFFNLLNDMFAHLDVAKKSLVTSGSYAFLNILIGTVIALSMYHKLYETACFSLIFLVVYNIIHIINTYRDMRGLDVIIDGVNEMIAGNLSYQINTDKLKGYKKDLAEHINHISEGLEKAIETSTRDERMKAELITNVSHDIKTPLTSIINYINLIKRENVDTEPLKGYIDVLDQKSLRLKTLIEDLIEASKASTGNIELVPTNLNMIELLNQALAEYEDIYQERNLELITNVPAAPAIIYADGRRVYRIIDNLLGNIKKYAQTATRVYIDLTENTLTNTYDLTIKNISATPLNVDPADLTKRFVRGDESRSSEGSGLGLSIAESLTTLQGGNFDITIDGDLFKVTVSFPIK